MQYNVDLNTCICQQVERIQNAYLYYQYTAKKQQIERTTTRRPIEKTLWHGTSSDVTDSINNNGFDRSYCGQHGLFMLS